MLAHLHPYLTEIKLTLAALVGLGAFLADASSELGAKGWEELGLKGILIAAVIFIGRLFLEAQKEHKVTMTTVVKENTQTLAELAALTKEQTDYFKAVTRNIVDEKMKAKPPAPLP